MLCDFVNDEAQYRFEASLHEASDFQTVLDIRFLLFAGFLLLRNIFDVFIQKSKSVYPVVHFEVTADLWLGSALTRQGSFKSFQQSKFCQASFKFDENLHFYIDIMQIHIEDISDKIKIKE